MRKDEVGQLLKEMACEFNVPVPSFGFLPIEKEVIKRGGLTIVKITNVYSFVTTEAGYKKIWLRESSRGVRKDFTAHEFFHYLDRLYGFEWKNAEDEECSVERRARKWLK